MSTPDLLREAIALHRAGRTVEAEAAYRRVLSVQPGEFNALHLLGVLRAQLGDGAQAVQLLAQALAVKPGAVAARLHMAEILAGLGRKPEALQACETALTHDPNVMEGHLLRGTILLEDGRLEEASAALDCAVALKPDHALALLNRARVRQALQRVDEALADCDRALALKPDFAEAHHVRGTLLHGLKRHDEALASFDRALTHNPGLTQACHGRIGALGALERLEEALAESGRIVALEPDVAAAHNNRGAILRRLRRFPEALECFDRAIALESGIAEYHFNRSGPLYELGRLEEAYAECAKALALNPGNPDAVGFHFNLASHLCDWRDRPAELEIIRRYAREGQVDPLCLLQAVDEPELHLLNAKQFAEPPDQTLPARPAVAQKRLRVAYLSADFRDHPVAHQVVELLERHDRTKFETYGICLRSGPLGAMRERLKQAFDHFVEAEHRSDYEIARMLAGFQIDIVVDLGGYTDRSRAQVLTCRPAPVAVSYLGYPGTLGADYVDYIIADANVIPPGSEAFYTESVVRLPGCFMPTDNRTLAAVTPSRPAAGLPEHGFVFCDFNKSNKLTPEMFDIWMRILGEVGDSVLWLNVDNTTARNNLRAEAEARGVAAQRLIFADRVADRAQHLARLALADLFLDTLPYNAHATANDFLKVGVPVLTCMGQSFGSRVAGSMLLTMGVEELIVRDLAQYEAIALKLARTPQLLAGLRAKLAANRVLFDTEGLTRNLETAYERMWSLHVQGRKPESFSVKALR